jgi:hypothetical protein
MATVATISVNFAQITNTTTDFTETPTSVKSVNPLTLAQYCLGTTATSNLNYLGGFVKKTGDAMTGMLTLPNQDPTVNNHSARKFYVDSRINSLSSSVNDTVNGFVRITGSTMTGMLTLPSVMPTNINHSTRKAYVDSRIDSLSATINDIDNGLGRLYLPKAGGTMSGQINMGNINIVNLATPQANNHAATKGYVDSAISGGTGGFATIAYVNDQDNLRVLKAGDTMTGRLTLNYNAPAVGLRDTDHMPSWLHCNNDLFSILRNAEANATTWDSGPNGRHPVRVNLSNGDTTFSRDVYVGFNTTGTTWVSRKVATEQYVQDVAGTRLSLGGGTMTGFINLHAKPTAPKHAATKDYVDDILTGDYATITYVNQQDNQRVAKAGDTMTGDLTINNTSPTVGLRDTNHMPSWLHCNNNRFYVLRNAEANATTWDSGPNGRHPLTLNLSNGNAVFSGDVTAYSDRRLKKNIKTIENALEKTIKLEGVTFEKIETQDRGLGLIAQDVKEILPEVVSEDEDGYLSVSYGNIVGLLVEAVKELTAKVEKLESKLNS